LDLLGGWCPSSPHAIKSRCDLISASPSWIKLNFIFKNWLQN
jgi:hypothetical protein